MYDRLLIIGLLSVGLAMPGWATYEVRGKINLGDSWQPKVFMAMIEELSDYYRASPDMIVDIATTDADGNFVFRGNQLPDENRFYRLYLMKEQNTDYDACLYVGGDDHNFIHVILNNDTQLEIIADTNFYSPFGNYQIRGDRNNHLMRELSRLVYPSFYFYEIKFPTELRLSEEKLFNDLLNFADTCQSSIAALAAINNTDMDEYFDLHRASYQYFGERLKREMPHDTYTKNYLRKLKFYTSEDQTSVPIWVWRFMALQTLLILVMGIGLILLWQRWKSSITKAQPNSTDAPTSELLTVKELEILDLIRQGVSNKEIAGILFIELSTVKTHINKIYAKLGVKSRKEAIQLSKATEKKGV
ncbi:MAG: hypothetical protein DHS20C18_07200 [Saprospiraceae bacterium]|nr:MAG: hypothetical protein DHS20C18_07200 [Saprospiraceae bacterium]